MRISVSVLSCTPKSSTPLDTFTIHDSPFTIGREIAYELKDEGAHPELTYGDVDIARYVVFESLCGEACTWENDRVRRYLDNQFLD